MPLIATGQLSRVEAMRQAGYAESTARQQSEVLGSLRNQELLQEALRDAGLDETFIAETIAEGLDQLQPGPVKLAYLTLAIKLLDGFPPKKIDAKHTMQRIFLGDIIDGVDKLEAEQREVCQEA
jgi:hypothetical protein